MPVTIEQLTVADAPGAWSALGFEIEGDVCVVGGVPIRLTGAEAGRGLVGWTLDGADTTELDGLPTTAGGEDGRFSVPMQQKSAPEAHPNGIAALDHVVAITPALERTVAALQAAGLDLRRIREEPTPAGAPGQAFFRLGPTILEVVQEPDDVLERKGAEHPAFFWGLAFVAPDLEMTAAGLGDRVSEVRDAVQPGRKIATLRRSAGLSLPVALMTPPPARG
jgi:hypothetical protein